ncbi:hypothetical protein D3C76_989540 [compost metagenome]
MAPQALSAPPANTLVVGSSPDFSAISGSNVPTRSKDSTRRGHSDTGKSNALAILSLHSLPATSSNNVPAASE